MHPPFFHVDHKIGPDPHIVGQTHKPQRRGVPRPLQISAYDFVTVPYAPPTDVPEASLPVDGTVVLMPHIHVVTAPQSTLRDLLGRLLIRVGQRLILAKHAPLR